MPITRVASTSPLVQRSCLRCGYRGEELQRRGETASYHCPSCGQDLYARPPKSYAEMEDIPVAAPPAASRPVPARGVRAAPEVRMGAARRAWRWLMRVLGLERTTGTAARPGVNVRAAARQERSARG